MWRKARASSTLGVINGGLRRRVAAGDIPGMIAGIQRLAQSADLIRAEDTGVAQVMATVEEATKIISQRGSMSELDATIAAVTRALSATSSPLLAVAWQALLGNLRVARLGQSGDIADLDAATSAYQQALAGAPESDPVRALYQERLAKLAEARAGFTSTAADDELQERLQRIALDGSDLIDQARQARDPAGLTAGIERLRQAADLTPADDPLHWAILSDVGSALRNRFELTGALADLDAAVSAAQQAVDGAAPGDSHRASLLVNLANVRRLRFEQTRAQADLDAAVEASRRAVDSCAADNPRRATILSQRGLVLLDEYRRAGSLDFLDEAVAVGQQAVAAAATGTDRAVSLMNLALSWQTRFERMGDLSDVDAAVEATRQALDEAGPDDPYHAAYLTSHATVLRLRGERTGSLADINAAVANDQEAVAASRPGEPSHSMRVSHLGVSLLLRYGLTGSAADLEAAVAAGYRSVAEGADDDPFRALCFANLSNSLLRRFERSGATADLNAAVAASEQACAVTPDRAPDRPRVLGNLANVLQARSVRLRALDDLNRAVDVARQAVAASPADDANRGNYLNSLANVLQLRFQSTREAGDIEQSVDVSRQALAAVPAGHPTRGIVLAGLSLGLVLKSTQTLDPADLTAAIDAARSGLELAAPDDPHRAVFLIRLMVALVARSEMTGATADADAGIAVGREAAALVTATPSIRAGAAVTWGYLAARASNWAEAVLAYRTAIDLLGTVAPRGLARTDQEYQLIGITGTGSRAAACCLELGETDLALELLEQGRAVLLGQALDTRSDLTDLARQHPDVADRFSYLRDSLDADPALGMLDPTADLTAPAARKLRDLAAERRQQLAGELDAVIAEVRALPGFEKFLLPATAGELLAAAGEGPVVLVNVDDFRSDALVLTPAGVRHVPLPDLSPADVRGQVTEFLGALGELPGSARAVRTGQTEARLAGVLGWLWDAVTGPVLAELDLTSPLPAGQPGPRVWWCPTGLLSLLPLHAAGHHGTRFDAQPQTVIDRVISSYSPPCGRCCTVVGRLGLPQPAAGFSWSAHGRSTVQPS